MPIARETHMVTMSELVKHQLKQLILARRNGFSFPFKSVLTLVNEDIQTVFFFFLRVELLVNIISFLVIYSRFCFLLAYLRLQIGDSYFNKLV